MQEDLVTIVLPIYNVEKYLDRCIKSVINQTYKNIEIILVDDESPDKCPEICDEWKRKDARIRVVHKKNEGLGLARNTGIEYAKGKYICFFDSDDYIDLTTIEKAVELANKTSADVVTFGYANVDNEGMVKESYIPETVKNTFRNKEVEKEFLPDMLGATKESKNKKLHMSAWASMYSMKLIKESAWRFVSEREIIAEDVYSLLVFYKSVKCVSVLHEALYFYCENGTSLTHTYRKDRYEKIKKFYIESKRKAEQLNYSKDIVKRIRLPYFAFTIAALKMIVNADCNYKEKKKYLNEIIYDETFRELLKEINLNEETLSRKTLWTVMRLKLTDVCYILIRMKR